MITKISVFCQKIPEKTVVKDAYSPKKINKAVIWDKKQTFINQVKIFKLNFLSFPLTKLENLSVHQIKISRIFFFNEGFPYCLYLDGYIK